MSGWNVRPAQEEVEPGATPLSANLRGQIDEYVRQAAARDHQRGQDILQSGANLATSDARTPAGILTAVREAVNALALAHNVVSEPAPGVVGTVVGNPKHAIAQYVAKHYPGLYRFLEASPTQYRFKAATRRSDPSMYGSEAAKGQLGKMSPTLTGDAATIRIRDDVWRRLKSAGSLEKLREQDPSFYREVVSVVPHEVLHGLFTHYPGRTLVHPTTGRVVQLKDRARQGIPFEHAQSHAATRFADNMEGITQTGKWAPRTLPEHISKFAGRYQKKGLHVMQGEGLVQRAAENNARQAGFLTRQEIEDDLSGGPLSSLRQVLQEVYPELATGARR